MLRQQKFWQKNDAFREQKEKEERLQRDGTKVGTESSFLYSKSWLGPQF